ncbi:PIG-L family deacetylase [Catenuloplanes atrovinosus]|uniref:LmbE family N-acetylglucosaminyl deacetylase n=1 Tax=Catenuloplanes atrovinosus TaxID=137266 RepID=A0AAE4CA50_9ACTN|nr:PIG-L family deacetylase [Catenuloplanes atrovinosus]MDR7276507.1 LmbE family N-acetylglucosaminyl deacetylase [Catenuloplanes atrovinosus]
MTYTIVSFHAHPDDETLLTGGTLARAAAEGHRVVLVTATLGEAGLASGGELGGRRHAELLAAAGALGCARVEVLGYRDSGLHAGTGGCFADAPVEEVAHRLAAILREEHADALTGYDARGGYGHPDHVQVHRVAPVAARLARTPLLLEATVDRRALRPLLAVLGLAGRLLPRLPLDGAATVFTPHEQLTHAVDVRRYARQKRAALRAHASQATGGPGIRTVAALAGLPAPIFAAVAGREWFIEPGRPRNRPLTDDVFATLRG